MSAFLDHLVDTLSRADSGPHFVTRDLRDPSVSWPVTRMNRDPWPSPRPWHESITTTYESWWVHDYCLLFSAIYNSEYYCTRQLLQALLLLIACQATAGPALRTKKKLCLTSYTFTPHLIMNQVFYGTDPRPTWPIHICRPIWPMTHDPLTHCLLCPALTVRWCQLNEVTIANKGYEGVRSDLRWWCYRHSGTWRRRRATSGWFSARDECCMTCKHRQLYHANLPLHHSNLMMTTVVLWCAED